MIYLFFLKETSCVYSWKFPLLFSTSFGQLPATLFVKFRKLSLASCGTPAGRGTGNEKTIGEEESEFTDRTSRKAWARLLTKVYELDPMICPKCGSEMRVIAVIRNPPEIRKILKHLRKIGRPPPGVDYSNIAV